MSIWIKRFLVLGTIVLLHLGTVLAQKNDDIDSDFEESLSEELAEGFDDIEAADKEQFGAPKSPIQREEDLISEEFDALEEEESITEDAQPKKGTIAKDEEGPTDEDLDAEFSPDELEREEFDEEVIAETPEKVEQIDQELEQELKEDRLEQEEDTEVANTKQPPQVEDEESKKAQETKQPEDMLVEEEPLQEEPLQEEPLQEETIAEEQKTIDEEQKADTVQQADEIKEEMIEEPIVEEEPQTEDINEEQLELVEEPKIEQLQPLEAEQQPQEQPESLALLPDEPNLELERFLDRIFKANSERLSDERWSQITQSIQEDTYRIQVGDTLWDISVTFFGNGHFWPKIWQLNDSITNPHLIYPGQSLRFISGGIETTPYIEVTDVQQEEQEQEEQDIQQQVADIEEDIEEGEQDVDEDISAEEDSLLAIEEPSIPPQIKSRPILKEIPKSLLDSDLNLDKIFGSLSERNNITIESIKPKVTDSYIQALHFISERLPRSLGKIVDVEVWHKTASIVQHIYIQSSNLNIGNTYSVFQKKHSIRSPRTGRMLGHAIELQGEIEVIQQMPRPRNIYKALVKKHNTRIEEGSHIGLISIPRVRLNSEGRQQNIRAEVVGGGNTANPHTLLAAHSFVFLDRGSRAGISVGDILTVLRNQSVREEKSRFVQGDNPPIAKIKVARVTPETTTAFVIQSNTEVLVGDYTRGR